MRHVMDESVYHGSKIEEKCTKMLFPVPDNPAMGTRTIANPARPENKEHPITQIRMTDAALVPRAAFVPANSEEVGCNIKSVANRSTSVMPFKLM